MNIKNTSISLFIITFIILVSSCGTPTPRPTPQRPPTVPETPTGVPPEAEVSPAQAPVEIPLEEIEKKEAPAQQLIASGRYLDAAILLTDLANSLPAPQKQDYQLRVASLLLLGNYIQQADQVLQETNVKGLDASFAVRKILLNGELALAKQMPEEALRQLSSLDDYIQTAAIEYQREYYRIQIDIHSALRRYADAALARARLEPLLEDDNEILENQETLLRDLQELDAAQLQSLSRKRTDNVLQGWLALAYIAKIASDEEQAQQEIANWRSEFPTHPVKQSIIATIVAQQPEALGRPTNIAVIVPMSGRFAKAASAVRNGLLTAYYADSAQTYRPEIRFYDEGEDPQQIHTIYQQAVSDGADFIIGPLNKEAVTNLAHYKGTHGGVLALNYGDFADDEPLPENFFQMSLSPEQEAIHVAEHAWLDGHTKAAAIYPDTTWGARVYAAFKARWEELGGTIVEYQTYDMKKSDYAIPIKQLLNIDESEDRYRTIRQLARQKVEYEPRRRKDVDFIFMAAFSRQGRLLRPQLRFHRGSDIPVYATSHVFSGSKQPDMDRDMNGVRFSDMPWTLVNHDQNDAMKLQIKTVWPNTSNRYMRLFALGIDAYKIVPELNRMRRNRFTSIQGTTGILYLDISNRIQRRLLWAQFQEGIPKVLAEF
ncbi:MAG: penicillin-binding protein activator [Gammaproteobacteria bacterium]|nr:penicillin-binding protein activator [Gammaproteobacteria bacterium]